MARQRCRDEQQRIFLAGCSVNLQRILASSPIDSTARRVTSQRAAAKEDQQIGREELAYLVKRIERKQRLLKLVLGIKSHAQHKNTVYKAGIGVKQFRAEKEPRALSEYLLCGRETQRLNNELCVIRKARKFAFKAQQEHNAAAERNT